MGDVKWYPNVKDFGAKGDGVTNDKAAVEACMRYADALEVERLRSDTAEAEVAALREDLEMFVKAQLGIDISQPGETFVQTSLRVYRMSKRRAAEFGIPEGENLDSSIEAFVDYDEMQKRLTAAEQRSARLAELLREGVQDDAEGPNYFGKDLWGRIQAAINSAESGASE